MTGIIVIAVAVLVNVAIGWVRTSRYDVDRIKPTWWVAREARSAEPVAATVGLNELSRRLAAGILSDAQIRSLAEDALAHQRDFGIPWNPAWGLLFEKARDTGKLPPATVERYAKTAVESAYTLEVRREVRLGEPLPARLRYTQPRVAIGMLTDITWISTRFSIDGNTLRPREWTPEDYRVPFFAGGPGLAFAQPPTADVTNDLSLGPHELGYHMTFHYALRSGVGVQTDLVMKRPWTLVPPDARTVDLLNEPALRPLVEQAIVVEEATKSSAGDTRVIVTIAARQLPVPVAYDVTFRANAREWPVGSVHFRARERSGLKTEGQITDPAVTSGDIVLRPSESVARRTVDITQIWDGEIVIHDVKIVSSQ